MRCLEWLPSLYFYIFAMYLTTKDSRGKERYPLKKKKQKKDKKKIIQGVEEKKPLWERG